MELERMESDSDDGGRPTSEIVDCAAVPWTYTDSDTIAFEDVVQVVSWMGSDFWTRNSCMVSRVKWMLQQ